MAPDPSDGIRVKLCSEGSLTADLRDPEWAVERVLDDLWAMYGEPAPGGFAVMTREELDGKPFDGRMWAAGATVGLELALSDLAKPLGEGVGIYGVVRDDVAVAVLLPVAWWRDALAAFATEALFVAVPTPNRIFLAPAEDIEAMDFLIDAWLEHPLATEPLTRNVFRFDGGWSVVA